MIIFKYDKTFEGLLTAVFDAYFRRMFPDALLEEGAVLPIFYDEVHVVVADEEKSQRVWKGLERKLSKSALSCLTVCWLSELPEVDMLLFRYMRKAIDAPKSIELNFGDEDVLGERLLMPPSLLSLISETKMFLRLRSCGRRLISNGCV